MVKAVRRDAGVTRDVALAADPAVPWFSVAAGSVHVHCLGRELREELELEELWGGADNVRWWPQTQRLRLDTIQVEGEGGVGGGKDDAWQPSECRAPN